MGRFGLTIVLNVLFGRRHSTHVIGSTNEQ
jgi:hypothetical protein